MKNTHFLIKISLILLSALLVLSLVAILLWPTAVRYVVDRQMTALESAWEGTASYQSLDVDGLTIRLRGLHLSGNQAAKQPLMTAGLLEVSLSWSQFWTFSRIPDSFRLDSASVFLIRNESGKWNYSGVRQPDLPSDTASTGFPKLAGPLRWLLNRLSADQIPHVSVTNTRMRLQTPDYDWRLDSLYVQIGENQLAIRLRSPQNVLQAAGTIHGDSLSILINDPFRLTLPLPIEKPLVITGKAGAFTMTSGGSDRFTFEGGYQQLLFTHPGIAAQPVLFRTFRGKTTVSFPSGRHMDILSEFYPGDLQVNHTLRLDETQDKPMISSDLRLEPAGMTLFRRSLPETILGPLSDCRFTGELGYDLSLQVDFNQVDSLKLEGTVLTKQFSVLSPGVDFSRLDTTFYQTVYDGTDSAGTVLIGTQNPDFVPFSAIPSHLTGAVLTNEDGQFFNHRGFNPEAFRLAMIANLESQGFRRGASTISMQLVKNLYLNRRKNLARKFQELVITWLLEYQRPVSKERMLEIYLNMIEWGPGIYGIGQASRFYFNKPATALTPEEGIFLATLVPSPKKYARRFRSGTLSPAVVETMDFIAGKMVRADRLDSAGYAGLNWESIQITGPAKVAILPTVTDSATTIDLSEDDRD